MAGQLAGAILTSFAPGPRPAVPAVPAVPAAGVQGIPFPNAVVILRQISNGKLVAHHDKKTLTLHRVRIQLSNIQRRFFDPPYGLSGMWSFLAQAEFDKWLTAPAGNRSRTSSDLPDPDAIVQRILSGNLASHPDRKILNSHKIWKKIFDIQRGLFAPPYGKRGVWSPIAEVKLMNWLIAPADKRPRATTSDSRPAGRTFIALPDPDAIMQRIASGNLTAHPDRHIVTSHKIRLRMNGIQRNLFNPPYGRKGMWSQAADAKLMNWLIAPAAAGIDTAKFTAEAPCCLGAGDCKQQLKNDGVELCSMNRLLRNVLGNLTADAPGCSCASRCYTEIVKLEPCQPCTRNSPLRERASKRGCEMADVPAGKSMKIKTECFENMT